MTRPLTSLRLVLRSYSLGDAAFVQDMYSRPEVQRYIGDGTQRVRTMNEARAKIMAWNERYLAEPTQGLWAVCLRLGMRHLGLSDAYYDAACELFDMTAPAAGKGQSRGEQS